MKKPTRRKASSGLAESPIGPIDALLKSLDLVAANMEAKYGAGILPTLCTPETAGKFIKVNAALTDAIQSGDYDTVKAKVESLKRGWLKLEEEAIASGYLKTIEAWYVVSPNDGVEYAFVRNEADAAILAAQMPKKASSIFTLADLARMLENGSVTRLTKPEKNYFGKVLKEQSETEEKLDDEIGF